MEQKYLSHTLVKEVDFNIEICKEMHPILLKQILPLDEEETITLKNFIKFSKNNNTWKEIVEHTHSGAVVPFNFKNVKTNEQVFGISFEEFFESLRYIAIIFIFFN